MTLFYIYDEVHSDFGPPPREFANIEDAIQELRRRAAIPWNRKPNRAPCYSWWRCERRRVRCSASQRQAGRNPSGSRFLARASLSDHGRTLVLSFIDALVTKTRLKAVAGGVS